MNNYNDFSNSLTINIFCLPRVNFKNIVAMLTRNKFEEYANNFNNNNNNNGSNHINQSNDNNYTTNNNTH